MVNFHTLGSGDSRLRYGSFGLGRSVRDRKLELGSVHGLQELLHPGLEHGSKPVGHLGLQEGHEQEARPDVERVVAG